MMANEKRLIDAYALSESISGIGKNMKRPRAVELACLVMISEVPTVDAVEVVRCKDCKWYKPRNQSARWEQTALCCTRSAWIKYPPDGFCSYGERKDNG